MTDEQIFSGVVDRLEASNGSGHPNGEVVEAEKDMVKELVSKGAGKPASFAGKKANRSLGV